MKRGPVLDWHRERRRTQMSQPAPSHVIFVSKIVAKGRLSVQTLVTVEKCRRERPGAGGIKTQGKRNSNGSTGGLLQDARTHIGRLPNRRRIALTPLTDRRCESFRRPPNQRNKSLDPDSEKCTLRRISNSRTVREHL